MDDKRRLINSLKYFETACRENVKLPRDQVRKHEVDLLAGAQQYGLTPEEISALINCICSKILNDSTRKFLVRCLLPNNIVHCDSVLVFLSWINTDEASNALKSVILWWIVAVFELIDHLENLHAIYAVIFYYIYFDSLRQQACALLSLLTRKEDIRLYRVQRLLRLRESLEDDPSLNSVLCVYKYYCPHLVTIQIPYSLKGLSTRYCKAWSNHIKDIQARNLNVPAPVSNYQNSIMFWKGENQVPTTELSKKYRLTEYLPEMNDPVGPVVVQEQDKGLVALCTIASLDDFLQQINMIELPRQALTVLRYPLAQHLISLCKDQEYLARFNFCLHQIFFTDFYYDIEELGWSDKKLLLSHLVKFSRYIQEGIPVVESFISHYLSDVWNGKEFADFILFFVTRLRLKSINDLKTILRPIERIFLVADNKFKVSLLQSLTGLLNNMVTVELGRCQEVEKIATASSGVLESGTQQHLLSSLYLFDDETEDFIPLLTIVHLIEAVDKLCITGLILNPTNTHLLHAAISFYALVANTTCNRRLPFLQIPPPIVVYGALFSVDGAAISRVGNLLCSCREGFSVVKKASRYKQSYEDVIRRSVNQIALLNQYAVDVSSALWRSKAFMRPSGHPSIFEMPDVVIAEADDPHMNASLTIFQHPALIGYALVCDKTVSRLPDDFSMFSSKVSKVAVKPYLDFLQSIDLDGIPHFVEKFLRGPSEASSSKLS